MDEKASAGSSIALIVTAAVFLASFGAVLHATHEEAAPPAKMEAPGQDAQADMLLAMLLDSRGVYADDHIVRFGLRGEDGSLDRDALILLGAAPPPDDSPKARQERQAGLLEQIQMTLYGSVTLTTSASSPTGLPNGSAEADGEGVLEGAPKAAKQNVTGVADAAPYTRLQGRNIKMSYQEGDGGGFVLAYDSMHGSFSPAEGQGGGMGVAGRLAEDGPAFDFHLQIRPMGLGVEDFDLSGHRVAYVGDACFDDAQTTFVQCPQPEATRAQRLAQGEHWAFFFNPWAYEEVRLLEQIGFPFERHVNWVDDRGVGASLNGASQQGSTTLQGGSTAFQAGSTALQGGGSLGGASQLNTGPGKLERMVPAGNWFPEEVVPGDGEQAQVLSTQGDVYGDSRNYIQDQLLPRLAEYDTLILGSQASQDAFALIRSPLESWVEAGGRLILLGTTEGKKNAFTPLFQHDPGAITQPLRVTAPQESHTLLRLPHDLAWDEHAYALSQPYGADPALFEPVLLSTAERPAGFDGQSGLQSDPDGIDAVLAASKPGAFGHGSVVLSRLTPHTVLLEQGGQEARHVLTNLILSDLFRAFVVDFGPDVPTDRHVASSSRTAYVNDDIVGQVPVRIDLHLWHD